MTDKKEQVTHVKKHESFAPLKKIITLDLAIFLLVQPQDKSIDESTSTLMSCLLQTVGTAQ